MSTASRSDRPAPLSDSDTSCTTPVRFLGGCCLDRYSFIVYTGFARVRTDLNNQRAEAKPGQEGVGPEGIQPEDKPQDTQKAELITAQKAQVKKHPRGTRRRETIPAGGQANGGRHGRGEGWAEAVSLHQAIDRVEVPVLRTA